MSYADAAAYSIAAQKLLVQDRVNMYQAVMLTKCDPEKHEELIQTWLAASDPFCTNTETTSNGSASSYTASEYAKLLAGG